MVATYAKQIYMEHRAPGAPPGSDLTYGLCTVALFTLGNLLTALLIDRVGRRPPLLLGLVGMAATMGTFAATDEPQHAQTPRLAGPDLGTCASPRARPAALAARDYRGERPGHWAPRLVRASRLRSRRPRGL